MLLRSVVLFYTRAAGILSLAYMGGDHLPFLHRGVSINVHHSPALTWLF